MILHATEYNVQVHRGHLQFADAIYFNKLSKKFNLYHIHPENG